MRDKGMQDCLIIYTCGISSLPCAVFDPATYFYSKLCQDIVL